MKIFNTITVLAFAALLQACSAGDALDIEVEKLLARMTLDEKIGQMLELNLDVLGSMKVTNPKVDREKVICRISLLLRLNRCRTV